MAKLYENLNFFGQNTEIVLDIVAKFRNRFIPFGSFFLPKGTFKIGFNDLDTVKILKNGNKFRMDFEI